MVAVTDVVVCGCVELRLDDVVTLEVVAVVILVAVVVDVVD